MFTKKNSTVNHIQSKLRKFPDLYPSSFDGSTDSCPTGKTFASGERKEEKKGLSRKRLHCYFKRKLFLTERDGRPCRKGSVDFKESDGC